DRRKSSASATVSRLFAATHSAACATGAPTRSSRIAATCRYDTTWFLSLRFHSVLMVGGCLLASGGCHSFLGYRGWPFPEVENTTLVTPAMRKDTIRQFAARADGTDSADQRAQTDQLARQIQIEPDPLVREEIIRAVGQYRTPLAGQVLEAGLNDDNPL